MLNKNCMQILMSKSVIISIHCCIVLIYLILAFCCIYLILAFFLFNIYVFIKDFTTPWIQFPKYSTPYSTPIMKNLFPNFFHNSKMFSLPAPDALDCCLFICSFFKALWYQKLLILINSSALLSFTVIGQYKIVRIIFKISINDVHVKNIQ